MLFAGFGFELVYILIALLTVLTIHEASHALVATLLGDLTPKSMGRLSLNPFAHLEPMGALMILVVGLGWGKPVMIDYRKLKPEPKIGMALVALAGPVSNLLVATIAGIPLRLHLVSLLPEKILDLAFLPYGYHAIYFSLGRLLLWIVWLSLALAVFNLIPISPLDGSRLWQIVLPTRAYERFARVEVLGLGLVLTLILMDRFLGTNILSSILAPPISALWRLLIDMTPPFQF
jgi:Zn-dependent protease